MLISAAAVDRNRVRMLLTTFFPRRDCCPLPRPVVDEAGLAALVRVYGGRDATCPLHLQNVWYEEWRMKNERLLVVATMVGLTEYVRAAALLAG